jgi:hypothetical protein
MISRRHLNALLVAAILNRVATSRGAGEQVRLVFVHGRGQAGLNPDDLKAAWLSALTQGAQALGRKLPAGLDVAFPFYANVLEDFVKRSNLPVTSEVIARGGQPDDNFLAFQAEVAQSIRARAGITDEQVLSEYGDNPKPRGPLNWEWVHAIFRAIDKHGGGLSGDAIEQFLRDVYLYTTVETVRDSIDKIVRAKLDERKTVIVGHSLGTVVAYNVLRSDDRKLSVPLLVTIGSPLGIRAIRDQLLPLSFPAHVQAWYNAFDPRDVVALYPLNDSNFPVNPGVENFAGVRNQTADRHGVAGYLNDKNVAAEVLDALGD